VNASVILCTHNPRRDYLERCLAGLRGQGLAPHLWELIVVDNRCVPPVGTLVDLSWHPAARVIQEDTLGLTPARLTGIQAATGDLLVFVDDDNVLDADFLEMAMRVAEEKPFLGSWSGQCRPEFESPPPEWTRRYWGNLAIREFGDSVWSNLPRLALTMPSGAGLCVRREVARRYVSLHASERRRFQYDRAGASVMSGGDNDLAACACDIGLGVGLMAPLKLTHLLPSERLTVRYLARLAHGIHYSSVLLDAERGIRTEPRALAGKVADILRIWRARSPHRAILRSAFRGRDEAARYLSTSTDRRSQR
jgi:glycosyltransferase involved in cell wall biosynthesis